MILHLVRSREIPTDADVVIVGAGPAGCAAASALRGLRVVVIDAGVRRKVGVGENLSALASDLLHQVGIAPEFAESAHLSCQDRVSRWGDRSVPVQGALLDLDGPGWLLNRPRFDGQLREAALCAGAHLVTPARVLSVERSAGGWEVWHTASTQPLRAPVVIDASGRAGRLSRVVEERPDRLTCVWTYLRETCPSAPATYVESAANGWWYTAPTPGGSRVLAFHTDPDVARTLGLRHRLAHLAMGSRIGELLGEVEQVGPINFTPASSVRRASLAAPGRFAVGDATASFEPLAAQGMFHALFTGVQVAHAVRGYLDGDKTPGDAYESMLDDVWVQHLRRRDDAYAAESRWIDQPFWARRVPLGV